jgi:RimJ/RimL family protein N-acetyltransferase
VTADLAPLFELRPRTPRLELRFPSDAELHELGALAAAGVHAPDRMPFLVPCTDDAARAGFVEEFAGFHLGLRAGWSFEDWHLELGVWAAGRPAGMQAVGATAFADGRTVSPGSWLGRSFHGRGVGTEMRTAVLALAFAGLRAQTATTGAFEDNPASARVSQKLGYAEVGVKHVTVRGRPVRERRFALARSDWERDTRDAWPTTVDGLDAALPLFGL